MGTGEDGDGRWGKVHMGEKLFGFGYSPVRKTKILQIARATNCLTIHLLYKSEDVCVCVCVCVCVSVCMMTIEIQTVIHMLHNICYYTSGNGFSRNPIKIDPIF